MAGMRAQLQEWAMVGARKRLEDLHTEMALITKSFPELGKGTRTSSAFANDGFTPVPKPRKAYKMTPAAKKAVSLRMKAYWAERRKQSVGRAK